MDGVRVGKHTLTIEAERLESISRRVGMRLGHWLTATKDQVPPPIPPPEWIEVFRYYQAAVISLLKEQRERAKLMKGEVLTEEQLHAQLQTEIARALETFGPEERAFALKLWSAKSAIPTTGTETKEPQ